MKNQLTCNSAYTLEVSCFFRLHKERSNTFRYIGKLLWRSECMGSTNRYGTYLYICAFCIGESCRILCRMVDILHHSTFYCKYGVHILSLFCTWFRISIAYGMAVASHAVCTGKFCRPTLNTVEINDRFFCSFKTTMYKTRI